MRALAGARKSAFAAGVPRDIGGDGEVIREAAQPLVTQDHYLKLLEECFIWSGSSVVYRRSALEAVGGFNEACVAADDYELYLKLARALPGALPRGGGHRVPPPRRQHHPRTPASSSARSSRS